MNNLKMIHECILLHIFIIIPTVYFVYFVVNTKDNMPVILRILLLGLFIIWDFQEWKKCYRAYKEGY